jgi:hypothetical protein
LRQVWSGGQTGVDLGALRAAREAGIATGGWCPPDATNERGAIPGEFALHATPEECSDAAPDVPRSLRTEWNVRDCDATLILAPPAPVDAGTDWTLRCVNLYAKPLLALDPAWRDAGAAIIDWLERHSVSRLNVAGPPESAAPGLEQRVHRLLSRVFAHCLQR